MLLVPTNLRRPTTHLELVEMLSSSSAQKTTKIRSSVFDSSCGLCGDARTVLYSSAPPAQSRARERTIRFEVEKAELTQREVMQNSNGVSGGNLKTGHEIRKAIVARYIFMKREGKKDSEQTEREKKEEKKHGFPMGRW